MVEDTRAAIDALQTESLVDSQQIWLFGYSLGGMVGLHTAALDDRVSGVAAICAFTPMRTDTIDKKTGGIARYSHEIGLMPKLGLFIIGQSDFRKDWFFQHVPHNEDRDARAMPYRGVVGRGRATPFAITFDLPYVPRGVATLRIAICGAGARGIDVSVNDQPAGQIVGIIRDGAITRHSIQGIWRERRLEFDAALLRKGTNNLTLTVTAGPINNGILYDYLRLELAETVP